MRGILLYYFTGQKSGEVKEMTAEVPKFFNSYMEDLAGWESSKGNISQSTKEKGRTGGGLQEPQDVGCCILSENPHCW